MAIANIAKKALGKALSGHTKDTNAQVKSSSELLETTKKAMGKRKKEMGNALVGMTRSSLAEKSYVNKAKATAKAKGENNPEAMENYGKSDVAGRDKLRSLKVLDRWKNVPSRIAKATSTKK